MIPKVIHYCWFGRGEKPELALKCIESWKHFCPDYTIKEWNEDNFDIHCNRYVEQAYEAKKFAFVSDYARLFALAAEGGIYMDTDVMLIKNLDPFLEQEAFIGLETADNIQTGIIAAEKNDAIICRILDSYESRCFVFENGTYDLTTNVKLFTDIFSALGFEPNGKEQQVGSFHIYPKNVFCPEHSLLEDAAYMKDTVCIHYFAGSWKSEATRKREASRWWKLISKPAHVISGLMEKLFGEKWDAFKQKTFWFIYGRQKQDK